MRTYFENYASYVVFLAAIAVFVFDPPFMIGMGVLTFLVCVSLTVIWLRSMTYIEKRIDEKIKDEKIKDKEKK